MKGARAVVFKLGRSVLCMKISEKKQKTSNPND